MALVTSGSDITVIVLDRDEANALASFVHWHAGKNFENGNALLWELHSALVPDEEVDR